MHSYPTDLTPAVITASGALVFLVIMARLLASYQSRIPRLRRAWAYVVGGMTVVKLTLETAGIAIDQVFGHIHDPSQLLGAVPIMVLFTGIGVVFAVLFLRGVGSPASRGLTEGQIQRIRPTAAVRSAEARMAGWPW